MGCLVRIWAHGFSSGFRSEGIGDQGQGLGFRVRFEE